MTQQSMNFTVVDPRTFDGDPYDVAGRAVLQVEGLVRLTRDAAEKAKLAARNAEMSRRLDRDEDPDGPGWDNTVEGRHWREVETQLAQIAKELSRLQRAAAFNPKAPLR